MCRACNETGQFWEWGRAAVLRAQRTMLGDRMGRQRLVPPDCLMGAEVNRLRAIMGCGAGGCGGTGCRRTADHSTQSTGVSYGDLCGRIFRILYRHASLCGLDVGRIVGIVGISRVVACLFELD